MNNSIKNNKKIGIMGGTFNPIHNGHIIIAQKAYEAAKLDKIMFIPSGNSYMKNNVLEASKRLEMVKLAVCEYPDFEFSEIEINRAGNTYTCETLEILTDKHPDVEYYFIIGADSLFNIEKWKNPEKIFKLATLICAVRDDYDLSHIKAKGNELSKLGASIIYLDIPKINISSTNVRENVKSKLSIENLVPKKVAEYILQERLYYEED